MKIYRIIKVFIKMCDGTESSPPNIITATDSISAVK